MGVEKIKIHLTVDGQRQVYEVTKTIWEYEKAYRRYILYLSLNIENVKYEIGEEYVNMEYAVIDLQKQLPENIQIVCCQNCKHGNYFPYGDIENQIFCFLNFNPKDKNDVVEIFNSSVYMSLSREMAARLDFPANELLHYCEKYEKIDDDAYYTYNDWNYHFKDKEKQG